MKRLSATDYEVRELPRSGAQWHQAREFVAQHHYSKGCSRTAVYCFGLFRRGEQELLGVAMWLPPTGPAAKSVNRCDWTRVLSLTRLAVHPDVPQNGASYLIGRSIRHIKRDGRFLSLLTFADTFKNHEGAIYRATNWQYCGITKPTVRWEDADGRQVAVKSTVSRTNAEMKALGYRKVGAFAKHKFVMHLESLKSRFIQANHNLLWWALVA